MPGEVKSEYGASQNVFFRFDLNGSAGYTSFRQLHLSICAFACLGNHPVTGAEHPMRFLEHHGHWQAYFHRIFIKDKS